MAKFVSLLRVRDAVLSLQQWKDLVDSQGCKHLMHFLASKRKGVNATSFVRYQEEDDFAFADEALKVRPGKQPYYDPLDGEFRIETHPHSNIATARKKTFRDGWKAAESKEDATGESWKFTPEYVTILKEKMLSKGGGASPIPVYDLCAWLYRSTQFDDAATIQDVTKRFRSDYSLSATEFQSFFTEARLDGKAEEGRAFFTRHQIPDAMLLEMLRQPLDYDLSDAIAEAFSKGKREAVSEIDIAELLTLGRRQLALQGPPGTGKTYLAKRAALRILKASDDEFASKFIDVGCSIEDGVEVCKESGGWSLVQFHPSYTYEEFVRGLAATVTATGQPTFEVQDRTFAKLCEVARISKPRPVVLIVDEINRGDLSKVLGELIYALEYRDEPIALQYSKPGEIRFSIPENLFVLATLNTADRSISNIDFAIRRRFDFVSLAPDRAVIERSQEGSQIRDGALAVFDAVSALLTNTPNLAIGHSYFLATDSKALARAIVFQVLPLLAEYRVEGLLGDADSVRLPGWPGKSGLPFSHERPFELVTLVEEWLETFVQPEPDAASQA